MFCSQCGARLKEVGKFCYNCGAALPIFDSDDVSNTENVSDPFSMMINSVFNISGKGYVLAGIIESGEIRVQQSVCIEDYGTESYVVSNILIDRTFVETAQKGKAVSVLLKGLENPKIELIKGKKLISADSTVNATDSYKANDVVRENEETSDFEKIYSEISGPISEISGGFAVNGKYRHDSNKNEIASSFVSGGVNARSSQKNTENVGPADLNEDLTTESESAPQPSSNPVPHPEPEAAQQMNPQATPGADLSALVTLRTGSGWFTWDGVNTGKLIVSNGQVSYQSFFGMGNHSYSSDQILTAVLGVSHIGISFTPSYTVTLKNGKSFVYLYSLLQKSKLQMIDAAIHSTITTSGG